MSSAKRSCRIRCLVQNDRDVVGVQCNSMVLSSMSRAKRCCGRCSGQNIRDVVWCKIRVMWLVYSAKSCHQCPVRDGLDVIDVHFKTMVILSWAKGQRCVRHPLREDEDVLDQMRKSRRDSGKKNV